MKKHEKESLYFTDSAQGAGLGFFPGRFAVTKWITRCYHINGKVNGKNFEPGVCFKVLRCVQIKRRRFAFIEVGDKTELISVGDIVTG